MPTTVHISGGFVHMLHFASYVPDVGRYQEYKEGIERYMDWFDPALKAENGAMTVPSGPGVGITNIADILEDAREV
jgi:L-alanine-DL-glutamate epimerase-like enolase superfamily enzyme